MSTNHPINSIIIVMIMISQLKMLTNVLMALKYRLALHF